jgi:hypothetical protein
MSVLLFYALIILAGGLVAATFVALPRVTLHWALSAYLPAWLIILLAYLVSVGALKVFNRTAPGLLMLSVFVFVCSTLYHLGEAWKVLDTAGRIVTAALVAIALIVFAAPLRVSGSLWPLALLHRIMVILR